MRSIFAAISSALRGVFALLFGILRLPGALLGSVAGGSLTRPPAGDSALVADLKAKTAAANAAAIEQSAERMARIISSWALDSVVADQPAPAPTPPRVSRVVANWMPGLTRDEALALVAAKIPEISAHIRGTGHINGVRPVQKLVAGPWPPATAWNPEVAEPTFLTHAVLAARP